MKTFTLLGTLMLICVGCTNTQYQEMQYERDKLIENYENLRREHDGGTLETEITNQLHGKWKFLNLEVEESDITEDIAAAKAALYALDLKNLTLEFFEQHESDYYRGKRGTTEVTGQFNITTVRFGDEPFPFIRFIRRTGPLMAQLLFAAGPDGQPLGLQGSTGIAAAKSSEIGISVTEERLYLTMYGKMALSPDGWVQSGGLLCSFERIKEKKQ